MANKKSFKSDMHPAMQFISQTEEPVPEEVPVVAQPSKSKAPDGYKLNPLYIETKSKRVQLLIPPSVHERLKRYADKKGESVNEIANLFLKNQLEMMEEEV